MLTPRAGNSIEVRSSFPTRPPTHPNSPRVTRPVSQILPRSIRTRAALSHGLIPRRPEIMSGTAVTRARHESSWSQVMRFRGRVSHDSLSDRACRFQNIRHWFARFDFCASTSETSRSVYPKSTSTSTKQSAPNSLSIFCPT